MQTTTFLVQVHPGEAATLRADAWHPWVNCQHSATDKPDETTLGMIAARHLRDRGGLIHGENYKFTIHTSNAALPTWPNGTPRHCYSLTMWATKQREAMAEVAA